MPIIPLVRKIPLKKDYILFYALPARQVTNKKELPELMRIKLNDAKNSLKLKKLSRRTRVIISEKKCCSL